jgi:hypothetical protein
MDFTGFSFQTSFVDPLKSDTLRGVRTSDQGKTDTDRKLAVNVTVAPDSFRWIISILPRFFDSLRRVNQLRGFAQYKFKENELFYQCKTNEDRYKWKEV